MTFVCRKGLGELFEKLNVADHVFELNKKNKSEFKKSISILKSQKWEHLICPHESIRSHKIAFTLKANLKVGFKKYFNFFIFDKSIHRPMQYPDALRQLSLLTLINTEFKKEFETIIEKHASLNNQNTINFKTQPEIEEQLSMSLNVKVSEALLEKFNVKPRSVFIAPGSVWPTKRWTSEGFNELIRKLKNEQVYLVGSPDEKSICDKLSHAHSDIVNLCGETSLWELTQLLSTAKCLFSNDSGTMHVASVVSCPTVSVFGPTTLELGYRPWNDKSIVVQKPLHCRPCGKHGHKKCPLGTHECMKSISGEEVFKKAQSLIEV